ncbi:MAG: hypothetical protein MZW92_64695 [Comamonadaceae bacterium]|nr:hypothetical protein [Comamonadaceae bacterium]
MSFLYAALVLTLPLMLSFWFAPLLVAWKDMPALKALFFSIVAVARNWRAFAVLRRGGIAAHRRGAGPVAGAVRLLRCPGHGGERRRDHRPRRSSPCPRCSPAYM